MEVVSKLKDSTIAGMDVVSKLKNDYFWDGGSIKTKG